MHQMNEQKKKWVNVIITDALNPLNPTFLDISVLVSLVKDPWEKPL